MPFRQSLAALAVTATTAGTAAHADGWAMVSDASKFRKVEDKETFVEIVSRGTLERFGITLAVLPDGEIEGRAFGREVTGAWVWQNGFFCRDLSWGTRDIGANCQEVKIAGNTLRFTSDEGKGRFADLRLR